MQIAKINFKTRSGKFAFSKGKEGHDEKKLIRESLDILAERHDNRVLASDPLDRNLRKQSKRYENVKSSIDKVLMVETNQDFDSLEEDRNRISYNDVCDMITGIHEHIRILEKQGIGFQSGTEEQKKKYADLRRMLDNLNEMKGRLTRTVQHPQGLFRRRVKKSSGEK